MTKAWLMRREGGRPAAVGTMAPMISSVCRLPFMMDSTSPELANSTAFAADAWLCSVDTTGRVERLSAPPRLPSGSSLWDRRAPG